MVCWLLKIDEEITYLQQNVLLFAEQWKHLTFFIKLLCFFTLLCSILLLPISSFKFLFCLKAVTGSFQKISLNALFIYKMFQHLWTTLLISGRDELYINNSGIFFSFEVVLFKVLSPLLLLYVYLLAVVANIDLHTSVWAPHTSSFGVVKILLILSAWQYGILSFSELGWLESIWKKFWWSVLFW